MRWAGVLASEQNSVYCTSSYIVYVSAYEVCEAGLELEQPRAALTGLVLLETRGRVLEAARARANAHVEHLRSRDKPAQSIRLWRRSDHCSRAQVHSERSNALSYRTLGLRTRYTKTSSIVYKQRIKYIIGIHEIFDCTR